MCLILTVIAALVCSICYTAKLAARKNADKAMLTVTMMFWSAALMFAFVGFSDKISGGDFLELTLKDAFLGSVVIIAGIFMYFFLKMRNKR